MPVWTRHVEGGPRRVNHAAVSVGEYIYSFGGYCTGADFEVRRDIDIHMFDSVALKWVELAYGGDEEDIPYQRYGHTAVAYNGCCIVYGGRNDVNGVSEHIYKFDVEDRKWSRPEVGGELPLARDGHSCTVIGDDMYLFGGYEEESMAFSNSVYSLNLLTYQWSRCKSGEVEPLWRDFHSATSWKHYMIVFGGRSDEHGPLHTNNEIYDSNIYIYDTVKQEWSKPDVTGDAPEGRRSHCAFEYEDQLYIFGGYNGKLGTHYNDLYQYDLEKSRWTLCKPTGITEPTVRRRACCCVIDKQVYVFGGTSPDLTGTPQRGQQESLMDLSDLHVLDMDPSLKTCCMLALVRQNIPKIQYERILPTTLAHELQAITQEIVPMRVPNG